MIDSYRHPPARCPACGDKVDAATNHPTNPHGARMRAGDVTVCAACASIAVVEKVTRIGRPVLRKPTLEERRAYAADPNIARTQTAIIQMAREEGRELRTTRPVASPAPRRTAH